MNLILKATLLLASLSGSVLVAENAGGEVVKPSVGVKSERDHHEQSRRWFFLGLRSAANQGAVEGGAEGASSHYKRENGREIHTWPSRGGLLGLDKPFNYPEPEPN